MKFCSSCGNELKPGALFCPNCGAKQPEIVREAPSVPPVVTSQAVNMETGNKKKLHPLMIVIPVILAVIVGGVFLTLRDKSLGGVWQAYEIDGEAWDEEQLEIVFMTKDEVLFRNYQDESTSVNLKGELRSGGENKYRVRPKYVGTVFYYQEWLESSISEEDVYSFDDFRDFIEHDFYEGEIIDVDQKNKTITIFDDYFSSHTDYDDMEFTLQRIDRKTMKVSESLSGYKFMLAPLKK